MDLVFMDVLGAAITLNSGSHSAICETCEEGGQGLIARLLQDPMLAFRPADGVAALTSAQEAGETLLSVSQKISEAAPALSESAMEVAECSLSVAARFAAVPCALLLTDVALSCTLEASRLKHAGQLLHEVRRDTIGTLQTLQANLSMAKIVGMIDAETLKLSLGLVGKATGRILAALRQVGAAATACDPGGCPVSRAFQLELQARLQNDRLLRQLHSDLRELRKRAGTGLSQRGLGTCSPETYGMVAELLHGATDSVVEAFVPDAELFRTLLSEHFDFVDACGSEVQAISCDLRAQLLQYLLLADSQAVLTALEHQVKPRLRRCCESAGKQQDPLLGVLHQHFERLTAAVVSARLR
ncbi:unnamed protein product [Symbiodinium sp. KB8]|nr:unnamed protein product [Symbiodinium sp. KB8]